MRSPARIPLVLAVLQRAWEKAPDMRLGQIILSTRLHEGDSIDTYRELYKREDAQMIESILKLYGD